MRGTDEILEKSDSLTREERALIQRHSFETYQIFRGITDLEDITIGRPTIEMWIIAVVDLFQALAQSSDRIGNRCCQTSFGDATNCCVPK